MSKQMLDLAKRIAERAGKNAKVAPELLYAPILWELQDDARRCSAESEHPAAISAAKFDMMRRALEGVQWAARDRFKCVDCCGQPSTGHANMCLVGRALALSPTSDAQPQASAVSDLARAVVGLEYYINNPSAWERFDNEMSERLRPIVEMAKHVRNEPQTAPVDDLEDLVARFSKALLAKLKLSRANGRSGWERDDWEQHCQEGLLRHVDKGDPRDVAAYCAFMWHHGWTTKAAEPQCQAESAPILKAADELHELGFEAGWNAAIEECATIAERAGCGNKDCKSCYGNQIAATARALTRPERQP